MRSTNMFRKFNDVRKTSHETQQRDYKYILVADENLLEGKVLGGYLENLGYSVKTVGTGTDALKIIQSTPPMLVVSSLNMPEVHGYQLLQILKGDPHTSAIPFLMISTGDITPDKAMGYQQGCDDYITKPLDPSELKNRVEALLRRSKQYDQIKFASNLQSTAAARDAIKSEIGSEQKSENIPPQSTGIFKTVIEEEEVAATVITPPEEIERTAPPATVLTTQPKPPPRPLEKPDVAETPVQPAPAAAKPAGQESIRQSVEVFRAAMDVTAIKPKPVFDDSVTDTETPPPESPKPDQPPPAPVKPVPLPSAPPKPVIPQPGPPAAAARPDPQAKPAETPAPAESKEPAPPEKAEIPDAPAPEMKTRTAPDKDAARPAPPEAELSTKEEPDAILEEEDQEEEKVEISIKKIAPETKLKSESSLSLNLPARKDIAHADGKTLYKYGHDIINVLQEAGGKFSANDFLAITAFSDKLAEVATASNELLSLALSKETKPTLATHSINSSIIALRIGKNLQIQAGELSLLGAAALLLDLGMIRVNPKILNKSGGLTDSERKKVQQHVEYSVKFIENAIKDDFQQECQYMTIAISQHHERQEGQGYPQNLTGDKIIRAGKILGIADTYEAMCHTRFHRSRQTTYRALQEVVGMKKTFFDPIILRALVNELTFFPIGCFVRLNTEEIGVVIDVSPVHSMRPKVKILADSDGAPLDSPKEVDLVQSPFLYVVKPLEDEDIPDL